MTKERFRKAFLLVLVISVSVLFALMLRSFLVTILMAALASALVYPSFTRLAQDVKSRPLASALTVLLTLLLVIGPLLLVLGLVVNQAIRVTENVVPFVERLISQPTYFEELVAGIPGYERIEPYRDQILLRLGDVVNALGGFLAGSLSDATRGTVTFVFHFFLLLYTMFFLLLDGPSILRAVLTHLPLREVEKQEMIDRFVSVTRASIKGTLVIGVIQGTLSGIAFAIAGIPNSLFWTVVMVVLSIIPMVGGALVWVPACVILVATGEVVTGILLAAYCGLVVGSVDNLLRPRLVGRDTKMHDLLILFSILGGILTFGPVGFILGPVLAGLFVTSWGIFAVAYRDLLHDESVVIADQVAASDSVVESDPVVEPES